MTTTINASTSAGGGLINSADASGILQLQTASTAALTIDGSQNVGIGTSSPNEKLEVANAGGSVSVRLTGGDSNSQQVKFYSATQQNAAIYSYYNAGSPYLALINNGSERMRIDSSGNVGIGVTPSAWRTQYSTRAIQVGPVGSIFSLSAASNNNYAGFMYNSYLDSTGTPVYLNSNYASGYYQQNGQHIWYNAPSGTAGTSATFTQAMTLDASGNLGIGTTSPAQKLHVAAPIAVSGSAYTVNSVNGLVGMYNSNMYIQMPSSGSLQIWKPSTDAVVTFDSSGNLLVGSTSSSGNFERIYAKGSGTGSGTYTAIFSNSAGTYIFGARDDGGIYTPTIGTSTGTALILTASGFIAKSSSSIRYKKDVEPIDIGLDFVLSLEPVKYNLKDGDVAQVGFIAEDFPDARLVSEAMVDPQDETKGTQREGVNYANLVAPLVKAIQEQQALITQLTTRLEALENK